MNLQKKVLLLEETTELIKTYLSNIQTGRQKVVNFHSPSELQAIFDFSIEEKELEVDAIMEHMQSVLKYSVSTQHPRFFNQLYAGASIYSIIAELLTSILNTSMATYEIAPLFTLMEEYIFDKVAQKVGRKKPYDGMMLPGGSTCNLYAMQFARYTIDSKIHISGLYEKKHLVVFTSDQSHYSLSKSAMLMGMGKQSIIKIKTLDTGEMDIDDLEIQIQKSLNDGQTPMMINATAGTTVLGAYDPLEKIAKIAKKYAIWFHVDAIWGGGVLLHETLKEKIKGIERADSFGRNPHKMMGATLQCSIFMTKHIQTTASCNTLKAQYLFNDDKGYGVGCDTGDKYIQCGRRVDVLKIRLQRKATGEEKISKRIENAFEKTSYLVKKIEEHPQLLLVQKPTCTNTCFRFIPKSLTNDIIDRSTAKQYYDILHPLTAKVKQLMIEKGKMMTTYSPAKGLPNFFRMIIINPEVTYKDLDFVVEHIVTLGNTF